MTMAARERLVSVRERVAALENVHQQQQFVPLMRSKLSNRLEPGKTTSVTFSKHNGYASSFPSLSRQQAPHADQSYEQNSVEKGQFRREPLFSSSNMHRKLSSSSPVPAIRNGSSKTNVTAAIGKEPRNFTQLSNTIEAHDVPQLRVYGNGIRATRSEHINTKTTKFYVGDKVTSAPSSSNKNTQTIIRKAQPLTKLPKITTTVIQTPSTNSRSPPISRSELLRRMEIDEQKQLMKIIQEARAETIDRYSRLRTSQIIANSARKQTQIWRDTKDFIACQLIPEAVRYANQSRHEKKTAAEIVASIRFYP